MPAFSSIMIGGSLLAGGIGGLQEASAADRAALLQDKAVQEWLRVNVPDIAGQQLSLEEFIQTGRLTPELEQAAKLAETEFAKVQADPKLKEARLRALSSLEEQGFGGEQVQDEAAREQAIIDSGAANRGRQEAILGDMERRGQLGSGLELAARQDAAQAEGDRLASQAMDLESQRRLRGLEAISQAGDLAGDIQSDDWKMASDVAKAKDAINLFNTQNAQSVAGRNVDRNNDASRYNLDLQQGIADKNVASRNYQQEKNKALIQQQFENKAAKAAGVSGQYGQQAKAELAAGQSAADMWGSLGSGLSKLGSAYGSDDDKKKKGT